MAPADLTDTPNFDPKRLAAISPTLFISTDNAMEIRAQTNCPWPEAKISSLSQPLKFRRTFKSF
jgi:hypothetical protein